MFQTNTTTHLKQYLCAKKKTRNNDKANDKYLNKRTKDRVIERERLS